MAKFEKSKNGRGYYPINIGKDVTNALALEVIKVFSPEKILFLNLSKFNLFQDVSKKCTDEINRLDEKPDNELYDLIVADIPLGLNSANWESSEKNINVRVQKNWTVILEAALHLKNSGLGLFLAEPHSLRTNQGQKVLQALRTLDFQTTAIFNTPEKILFPETSIQPTILLVSKASTNNKLFLAELINVDYVEAIVRNFKDEISTTSLLSGVWVKNSEFKSFYKYKIANQISALNTQYKEYISYQLSEVSVCIKSVRNGERFEERANSIYVPKLGKSKVVSNLEDMKLKHHNYYQVQLSNYSKRT